MSSSVAINQTPPISPTNSDTIPGDFNEIDVLEIEMDRAGVLQRNLEVQKNEIQRNNQYLSDLQSALEAIDAQLPSDPNNDPGGNVTMSQDAWKALQGTAAVNDVGSVNYDDTNNTATADFSKGGLTKAAAALKDEISKASNNSQMDTLTFQGTFNNYNQQMEMCTNILQEIKDTREKIVGNVR